MNCRRDLFIAHLELHGWEALLAPARFFTTQSRQDRTRAVGHSQRLSHTCMLYGQPLMALCHERTAEWESAPWQIIADDELWRVAAALVRENWIGAFPCTPYTPP